jgi:hypothetical protein
MGKPFCTHNWKRRPKWTRWVSCWSQVKVNFPTGSISVCCEQKPQWRCSRCGEIRCEAHKMEDVSSKAVKRTKINSTIGWSGCGILSPKGIFLEAWGGHSAYVLQKFDGLPRDFCRGHQLVRVTAKLERISRSQLVRQCSGGDVDALRRRSTR